MFHRRLILLMVFFTLGGGVLLARVARLTLIDGGDLLKQAERRLVSSRWIETTRGRILDRAGRVLAMDRPAFDVAVDYQVITGQWAVKQAARKARRLRADDWPQLSPDQRDVLIDAELPAYEAQLEELWQTFAQIAGISRTEVERRKNAIIAHVQRMAASVWERRRLSRQRELSRQKETLVEAPLADFVRPIREQREPHVLLNGVDDSVAFTFRKLAERLPGLSITDGVSRVYPYETMDVVVDLSTFPATLRQPHVVSVTVQGVATDLIGTMRDRVFEEDIKRRTTATGLNPADDLGRYRPGDSVGSSGLEKTLEHSLRGERGRAVRRLDTGVVDRVEPAPGADVTLTLDIQLQAHIQALLDPALGLTTVQDWQGNHTLDTGAALAAGVAVIDIPTGDVLALASTSPYTREQLKTNPGSIFGDDILAPAVNRAFARPYQPGSIVKPLVLATAVTQGVHSLDTLIACNGHLLPNRKDIYRCWIYRKRFNYLTHSMQVGGPLNAVQAIARSCNIYFYTLGRALGPQRMEAMYRQLGVGEGFRFGLQSGARGFIGRLDGSPLEKSDAIFLGIGQGPVSWTPLHAANAYATLARRGLMIEPRLIESEEPQKQVDFHWDQAAVAAGLEGIHQGVAESFGTGNHMNLPGGRQRLFNVTGVRIAGKTGTAQSGPIYQDTNHDGKLDRDDHGDLIPLRKGDHGWTTVLVGAPDGPYLYAVSVVVEFGGSGSHVAAPIANQVVHALQQDGYLPMNQTEGDS